MTIGQSRNTEAGMAASLAIGETTPPLGSWFLTVSGIKFEPWAPTAEMVTLEDIAHGLSNICRFNGHCLEFYSVAQHSVIVSQNLPPELALAGLMHDATEAYCGDMVRPIKIHMPEYRYLENTIQNALHMKFGVLPVAHPDVKTADERALLTERRDVLKPSDHPWSLIAKGITPFDEVIVPLPPREARELFLRRYAELTAIEGEP